MYHRAARAEACYQRNVGDIKARMADALSEEHGDVAQAIELSR